jgi:7-keto-8-aminopelargonate synthetase-like enzyme
VITIPLVQRDEVSTVVLARELLDAGVFVNPVVAPAAPRGVGSIRLSLMLDHTPAMLEEAAEVLLKVLADNDQLPGDATAPDEPS